MISLFGERAKTVSGMDFVADLTALDDKIQANDFIITGEGSFDDQTLSGKAVAQIIDMCLSHGKDVAVLCGISKVTDEGMQAKFD